MKKVLIMEDELNIRSFVVINLKRAGYTEGQGMYYYKPLSIEEFESVMEQQ